MDGKQVNAWFQKAENERQRHETIFDDCIRLTMPNRKRFNNTDINEAAEDIFDETGANAVQEYTSRMQAGLFPSFSHFVHLEASSLVDPKDRAAVNRDLDDIQEFLFEEIWESNFAQESAESLNDLAISTGLMSVEEGIGDRSLHQRAIPITDFYLERAANDTLGGIYRCRKEKAGDLGSLYRNLKASAALDNIISREPDKPLEIIEYLRRDVFSPLEKSTHYVVVREMNEVIQTSEFSGVGSTPLLPFRWATAAGETWGRGPLLNALAAIRTTNLTVEMILENAAMAIIGIYQTDNDNTINSDTVRLLPGTILPKEFGTDGLQPVNMSGGNFNISDLVLNDQRMNIKRALFNDMLADPNKTPATATEVTERMADLAYRTSAGFSRVFYEFIVPYIRRCLYILEKRKDITLPVKNGRPISFIATSPLAMAQHGQDLQRLSTDFTMRANFFGPEIAAMNYNLKELHPWLQKRIGMNTKLHKTAEEIIKAIEDATAAAQEAMQQQQQMGEPPA